MTAEELREHARVHYPVGTVFKSAQTGRTYTVEKAHYWGGSSSVRTDVQGTSPYIYEDGKWGEIISKPKPTIIDDFPIY